MSLAIGDLTRTGLAQCKSAVLRSFDANSATLSALTIASPSVCTSDGTVSATAQTRSPLVLHPEITASLVPSSSDTLSPDVFSSDAVQDTTLSSLCSPDIISPVAASAVPEPLSPAPPCSGTVSATRAAVEAAWWSPLGSVAAVSCIVRTALKTRPAVASTSVAASLSTARRTTCSTSVQTKSLRRTHQGAVLLTR